MQPFWFEKYQIAGVGVGAGVGIVASGSKAPDGDDDAMIAGVGAGAGVEAGIITSVSELNLSLWTQPKSLNSTKFSKLIYKKKPGF